MVFSFFCWKSLSYAYIVYCIYFVKRFEMDAMEFARFETYGSRIPCALAVVQVWTQYIPRILILHHKVHRPTSLVELVPPLPCQSVWVTPRAKSAAEMELCRRSVPPACNTYAQPFGHSKSHVSTHEYDWLRTSGPDAPKQANATVGFIYQNSALGKIKWESEAELVQ